MYIYIYICIVLSVYMYTYIHVCVCMYCWLTSEAMLGMQHDTSTVDKPKKPDTVKGPEDSLSAYVCVHVHMHTHLYICIYLIYIDIYIHVCVCVNIYMRISCPYACYIQAYSKQVKTMCMCIHLYIDNR